MCTHTKLEMGTDRQIGQGEGRADPSGEEHMLQEPPLID